MNLISLRRPFGLLLALASLTAFAQPKGPPPPQAAPAQPLSEADKKIVCYIIGTQLGEAMVKDFSPAEIADIQKGFGDALAKKKPKYALEAYREQMMAFSNLKMQQAQERHQKEQAKKETEFKAKGVEQAAKAPGFLEKAAKEPSAQKTESGLVYIPLVEGKGESPLPTSQVKVHYRGKLMDNTVFDSSYERNVPLTMALSNTVPCWQEALPKMKVGGKAKIVCPAPLAYGERGVAPNIPPNAPLQFEIELLEVVAPQNMTPANP
ncbi:MAG: FKBP-type peptidyl-prolyl cis-trans isomerase [Cystobacterineae bacterium]|nr:FKBP-type peptidyl-prolyl cis-trans isomerase [Cystobacterineae bacterium]